MYKYHANNYNIYRNRDAFHHSSTDINTGLNRGMEWLSHQASYHSLEKQPTKAETEAIELNKH